MLCFKRGTPWILLVVVAMSGAMVPTDLRGLKIPTGLDLKLMKQVTTNLSENEAISPFVMSTLMTQVWLAADGTTRDEMTPVLGLTASAPSSFLPAYQSAIDYLSAGTSNVTTAVFNRIYVRDTFSIKSVFKVLMTYFYGAGVTSFSSPAQAATEINAAVANVTHNRIPDLVSADVLRNAELVLVSALYFKGLWQYPFNPAVKAPFLTEVDDQQVDMMTLNVTMLPYVNMTTFDAVALPYSDTDYCMLLIRPLGRNMTAVETLKNSLDSLDIAHIMGQLTERSVRVSMPRFKIEAKYGLTNAMAQLGIQEIFSPNANFGHMTNENLFVSDIIHKVFIEVTEQGTEAAGAGAVIFGRSMPKHFKLDRPFFAVVYNRQHEINMFSAYVASPSMGSDIHEDVPSLHVQPAQPAYEH